MPLPLAAVAAGAAVGTVVGSTVSATYGAQLTATLEPDTAATRLRAWWKAPLLPPTTADLVHALNTGFLSNNDFLDGARFNGHAFPVGKWQGMTAISQACRLWDSVRKSHRPFVGPNAVAHGLAHGRLDVTDYLTLMQRTGADPQEWGKLIDTFRNAPSPHEVLVAYQRGVIGDDKYKLLMPKSGALIEAFEDTQDLLREVPSIGQVLSRIFQSGWAGPDQQKAFRRAGGDWKVWSEWLPYLRPVIPTGILIDAVNRGAISPAVYKEQVARHGFTEELSGPIFSKLRERIPGPGEIIHFAVREAFLPDIAEGLGLYDEYPAKAKPWLDAHGLHAKLGFKVIRDGHAEDATWLDMYWAAHWIQPSAGQIFQMRHRFRPSRMKRFTDTGLNVQPFNQERVRQLLKLIDYPPWARDYLTGLSYTPLRLIDIRNAYRFRIITREEAIEQFQDRGVHPDDAKVQADLVEMQEQNKRYAWLDRLENNLSGQVVREILSSYEDGIHTQEQAAAQLNALIPYVETVNTLIHLVESRMGRRLAREGVRSVRRDYLNGTLSAAESSSQLAAMGIVDQRVAGYIALWSIQRNRTRRMASTAQIVGWVGKGMLHPTVARQRLLNLGWDEPDVVLMLDEQAGKLAALDAKRRAVADQAARARAKELESLQRTAERQRKALEADQRRATPRSTLDRWLCNGEISETFYLQRMRAMGYPSRIAHGYLIDAKRKKACAPAPEGSPFPPTNNGESDTGDSAGQSSGNGAANP